MTNIWIEILGLFSPTTIFGKIKNFWGFSLDTKMSQNEPPSSREWQYFINN